MKLEGHMQKLGEKVKALRKRNTQRYNGIQRPEKYNGKQD